MLNVETLKEVEEETRRFLNKLEKFKKAVAKSYSWKEYKTPPLPCPESAELKRSSLDLTKSLARMRKRRWWNNEKKEWEE